MHHENVGSLRPSVEGYSKDLCIPDACPDLRLSLFPCFRLSSPLVTVINDIFPIPIVFFDFFGKNIFFTALVTSGLTEAEPVIRICKDQICLAEHK